MNIWEISEKYAAALENMEIDEETGEVMNAAMYEIAESEFEEKAENYALYIKNLRSTTEGIKAERQKLAERQKAIENKTAILEDRLEWAMRSVSRTKFETARVALSFRKSEVISITDEGIIPASYMREKVTTEPDKTAIRAAIKNGETVDGAAMVEKYNLQIK